MMTFQSFYVVYASQNAGFHSFSRQKTLTTDYPKCCVDLKQFDVD